MAGIITFSSANGQTTDAFAVEKGAVGANIRGSLDYYIARNFSIQGKLAALFVRALEVPSVSHMNPYDSKVKTLKSHSVSFTGIDFTFGLRFHL